MRAHRIAYYVGIFMFGAATAHSALGQLEAATPLNTLACVWLALAIYLRIGDPHGPDR